MSQEFKNSRTSAALQELLERFSDEAGDAEIIGMHHRRHANPDAAAKYEARAEALRFTVKTAAAARDAAPELLVLTIDHRQGFEVSVHRSLESATNALAAWVDQFWAQDGPVGEDMPDDTDEAIKAYFDFADESYHIVPAEISA